MALLLVGGLLASPAPATAVTVTVGRQDLATTPNNNFGCTAHAGQSCIQTVAVTALSGIFSGDWDFVPSDGVITSWRVVGSTSGDGEIRLQVLRPVGSEYTFVNRSPAVFGGIGSPIPLSAPLPVRAGDRLGVETSAAAGPVDPDAVTRVEAVNAHPARYSLFSDFVALGATAAPTSMGYDVEPYFNADVVFYLPLVSSVSPASGSTAGGQTVTINGDHLESVTDVRFGTIPATSFTIVSNTQVAAVAPLSTAGTVDVTVTTIGGTSATSVADRFTFATPGSTFVPPLAGGGGSPPRLADFAGSRSSIRVNQRRKFSFGFKATPGLTGVATFKSVNKVSISRTQKVTLARKSFTVPASGKVTLRITLSKAKFRILKLNRKIRASVSVTLRNAAGLASAASKNITLRAP